MCRDLAFDRLPVELAEMRRPPPAQEWAAFRLQDEAQEVREQDTPVAARVAIENNVGWGLRLQSVRKPFRNSREDTPHVPPIVFFFCFITWKHAFEQVNVGAGMLLPVVDVLWVFEGQRIHHHDVVERCGHSKQIIVWM